MDAYVLAGEVLDPGAAGVQEAADALPHTVQRGDPVRHDRYGLHEREPVRARRPGVRPYREPHGHRAQDRGRTLAESGRSQKDRAVDGDCGWADGVLTHQGMSMQSLPQISEI